MQSVTVIGKVQSVTSIPWERGLSRGNYINLSGGMTRRADGSRVYVVRAKGQVTASPNRIMKHIAHLVRSIGPRHFDEQDNG